MAMPEVAWPIAQESDVRTVEALFREVGQRLEVVAEEDGTFTAFYERAGMSPENVPAFGFTESSRLEAARLAWAAFVVSR